ASRHSGICAVTPRIAAFRYHLCRCESVDGRTRIARRRTMTDERRNRDENVDAPNELSRRDFMTMSVAAGLVVAGGTLPTAAVPVAESDVQVKTPDGICDAAFIHPTSGAHPGVIVWPDAFGLRPAMRDIGKRIAAEGYAVLVPNPFYRVA